MDAKSSAPRFPRAEVEAAFQRTRAAQDADDWNAYCDLLSEDAVYVEHHFGTFRGREAIRAWLVPVMAPLKGWSYPTEWCVIEGDRVVFLWRNRLPGRRPDGSCYEFSGVTTMLYAGAGLFSYQEDVYNFDETRRVMKEWGADQAR
jgi:ketosteroid isomerase-like protein